MHLANLFLKNDTLVRFKAGQTIFKEGETGDSMFVLFEGLVEVFVSDKLVGTFEPVEIFGEMAVIHSGPRSATVVAKTECKLAEVSQKRLMLLLSNSPDLALHMMRMLVERIRWMNEAARSPDSNNAERVSMLENRVEQLTRMTEAQADEISRWHEPLGSVNHNEMQLAMA